MDKTGTENATIIGITSEIVRSVTGYDKSTASRVLRAMEAAGKATASGYRPHYIRTDVGTYVHAPGRPLTEWSVSQEALAAFFGADTSRGIIDLASKRAALEPKEGATAPPLRTDDAPYGRRKDGTPRAKPGRKIGSKIRAKAESTPEIKLIDRGAKAIELVSKMAQILKEW